VTRTHKPGRSAALISIFSIPIIWGTTFAVVQKGLHDVTPMVFVVVRFGIAAAVFLTFSTAARKSARILFVARTPEERLFRRDILILALALGSGYILQTIGLLTTTSSKSAFLTSTAVIWTPLLSFLMRREKMTLQLVLAVLATVAGIFLMTQPFREAGITIGDLLTIGCAMAFGVYIVWIDRTLAAAIPLAKDEHDATLMVTSSQIVAASLLFLIFVPVLETPHLAVTTFSVGALIYTGLIATGATAYLQARYQNHFSPTVAAVVYMLEPLVAMLIAELFLTERMGFNELFGGGLILLGVIIAQLKKSNNKEVTSNLSYL
jgi:drug/metabolite transporter (DMT)-like permease